MTRSNSSASALAALLPLVCAIAGCCCQAYPLPGEAHCPTDARRLYCSAGEEAVRRCPCGPDREFYGLKPTIWRPWPAGWRCDEGDWGGQTFAEPLLDSAVETLPPGVSAQSVPQTSPQTPPAQSDAPTAAPPEVDEITLPGSPFPPLEEGVPQSESPAPENSKKLPRPAPRPAPMMPDTDDGALLLDGKLPLALNAPEIIRRSAAEETDSDARGLGQPKTVSKRAKVARKPRPDNPNLSSRVEQHLSNALTL